MNLAELEKRVLNPLKTHIKDIDQLHVKAAYEDMINLVAVALQFEQEGNMSRFIETFEKGNKGEANLIYWENRFSYSLLKAVYTFADVFINVALREIYNKSLKKWSLDEFCKLQLSFVRQAQLGASCKVQVFT